MTLRYAVHLISTWRTHNTASMTVETTLAQSQILTAVADLAEDLINNHNFEFVLLGKTSLKTVFVTADS